MEQANGERVLLVETRGTDESILQVLLVFVAILR